jgi:predicted PhzF superfamily epimerase YddE/YHI9
VILQGAAIGRPSLLTVAVTGTAEHIDDVLVGGPVQPVLRGELTLPD